MTAASTAQTQKERESMVESIVREFAMEAELGDDLTEAMELRALIQDAKREDLSGVDCASRAMNCIVEAAMWTALAVRGGNVLSHHALAAVRLLETAGAFLSCEPPSGGDNAE